MCLNHIIKVVILTSKLQKSLKFTIIQEKIMILEQKPDFYDKSHNFFKKFCCDKNSQKKVV